MKTKLTAGLFALAIVILTNSGFVYAASLELTKIGSLALEGKRYTEWWYTGTKPIFEGTAEDNSDVDINAGGQIYSTQASISGNWSILIPLDKGDYDIVITSEDDRYSFKLHLGQAYPGDGSEATSSTTSVPSTGIEQTTALTLGVGVSLLALYFYFFESNKKRRSFEKNIISDRL